MRLLRSLCIAFGMYSRIYVPHVKWNEENMKYSMCFFPLVGILPAAAVFGWWKLCCLLEIPSGFGAAVFTVLPYFLIGGIHLDGYLDTSDARGSYGECEKKLEILKDSHVGAFAVTACVIGAILVYGCWEGLLSMRTVRGAEALSKAVMAAGSGFILARAFSGLAVVTFPKAKDSGLLHLFSTAAQKQIVKWTMILVLLAGAGFCVGVCQIYGIGVMISCSGMFLYYYRMAIKEFGGTTGDLAGYYVCMAEMSSLLMITVLILLRV